MSKEFEQIAYVEALTGLPTMSQFFRKEDCEEARLKHMFRAGRALGRREMKGETVKVINMFDDQARKGEYVTKADIVDAIEAIPEEV